MELVLHFAKEAERKSGFELNEFSIGGGFAAQYTVGSPVPSTADYATAIANKLDGLAAALELGNPRLVIEPGRGVVGQAGVALYRVGAIKEIPGIRKWVCIDGGISDNIRPALYGAKQEALVANKASDAEEEIVTIAGKLCQSGDVLVRDTSLASVYSGDIIAVAVCGAYSIPMSSNYNAMPKPAIIMVQNGEARLVRRRESYEDLTRLDVE